MSMPNLDALEPDELMEFWNVHQNGRGALMLFPEGGKGTVKATHAVANYAANKATAMRCRLTGNVSRALEYERICDTIYAEIPAFARW